MTKTYILSPARQLTKEEKKLVWKKPSTHIESEAELRICETVKRNWMCGEMKVANILLEGDAGSGKTQLAKALSYDFRLPYTKVTCFADMDKSDILGSILPVLNDKSCSSQAVEYKYYPSEIVRAYENGWILEIQEPTVIRDAAVLMALNSALEIDGSINLPNRIVHRHPDFIVIITTNRGYNGCRPLNESLRDRVQHCEKMDLPEIRVMVERAKIKTKCKDDTLMHTFAKVIVELDKTSRANAIKGVAGMRSYFFWVDSVIQGVDIKDALYHKVIYKITTDQNEIKILEQALSVSGLSAELETILEGQKKFKGEVMEICADGNDNENFFKAPPIDSSAVALRRNVDSEGRSTQVPENTSDTQSCDTEEYGNIIYHELDSNAKTELNNRKKDFRKQLNKQAREYVKESSHSHIKLIVHRPEAKHSHDIEYNKMLNEWNLLIEEMVRKTKSILEYEIAQEFVKSRTYGTKFNAERAATPDFRHFSKICPPQESPSLVVALRIDESASMNAYGRIEAAKNAALVVYEFCTRLEIPVLIYGDTADRSPMEQMSVYSYIDYDEPMLNNKYCLMDISGRSNNRDGMILRILANKLVKAPQRIKLLISISDGQPRSLPDYSGEKAISDMREVISEFRRKGVIFLSAAIGHDKETICNIYGQEHFIDISDLKQLPVRLVHIISKYL